MGKGARKLTRRRFTISDPIYDTSVEVFLNFTYEDMKACVDRGLKAKGQSVKWDEDDIAYYNDCEGAYLALEKRGKGVDPGKSMKRVLWIHKISRNDLGFITASHECMHAALEVLQERNVDFSDASEEAFVRYHDFLFGAILKKL